MGGFALNDPLDGRRTRAVTPIGPLAPWLVRLERAILHGTCLPPAVGDEVLHGDSVIAIVRLRDAARCGCAPGHLGIRNSWSPILKLCAAHATTPPAPEPSGGLQGGPLTARPDRE